MRVEVVVGGMGGDGRWEFIDLVREGDWLRFRFLR